LAEKKSMFYLVVVRVLNHSH